MTVMSIDFPKGILREQVDLQTAEAILWYVQLRTALTNVVTGIGSQEVTLFDINKNINADLHPILMAERIDEFAGQVNQEKRTAIIQNLLVELGYVSSVHYVLMVYASGDLTHIKRTCMHG